jgi:hypothetical protein
MVGVPGTEFRCVAAQAVPLVPLVPLVPHEILHNVTGLTDGDIQTILFGSAGGVSDNITQRLIKDCF